MGKDVGVADHLWTEELRANHLELSPQDLAFREFALGNADLLRGEAYRRLGAERRLALSELQPWPTFFSRESHVRMAAVALEIGRLLRTLPDRIFGRNPARIADFYDLGSPFIAEMILAPPDGFDVAVGRPDIIDVGGVLKCIEFNYSPNIGGWESQILADMHMAVPAILEFARHAGIRLSHPDPARIFFRHVMSCLRAAGLGSRGVVNVALILDRKDLFSNRETTRTRHLDRIYHEVVQETPGLEGRVVYSAYDDLRVRGNDLYLGSDPLLAVVEITQQQIPPAVYALYKRGCILALNGPCDRVLSTKRNLALLSSRAEDSFDRNEGEFISRHVPWTREVTPGTVVYEGSRVALRDLLRKAREKLVLKRAESYGGIDVALGCSTPEPAWSNQVDVALAEGGWVVQEYSESRPYLFQCGEDGVAPHDVIWGPFVLGRSYAGVFTRVQPKGGGAVNLSRKATQGVVFDV